MFGDRWTGGDRYEPYVGRWSRRVAERFLAWLRPPGGGRWVDVGCGTGALSEAVLAAADPAAVVGVDQSADYLDYARRRVPDRRLELRHGDAVALPVPPAGADHLVSGLVLNFPPDPAQAVTEMMALGNRARVPKTTPGTRISPVGSIRNRYGVSSISSLRM